MTDHASMTKDMMMAGAGYVAGRGGVSRLFSHPLLMLAAGAAIGYYGYKYRKEIVAAVSKATDMGKDFVLEQKESLSDVVEEAREAEEEAPVKAKK